MAYKVIILYRLYMPPYFLGTFTEYPFVSVYLCISCHQISLSPPVFLPAIIVRMEMPAVAGNCSVRFRTGRWQSAPDGD